MQRRTNLAIAGGITIALAAVAAAIAVNVGLLADPSSADGPGTFQPTSALESISTSTGEGTLPSTAPTTPAPAVTPSPSDAGARIDDVLDDHGRYEDDDHDIGDDHGGEREHLDSSGHGDGHDDDD